MHVPAADVLPMKDRTAAYAVFSFRAQLWLVNPCGELLHDSHAATGMYTESPMLLLCR
jgi:hypothetical protein